MKELFREIMNIEDVFGAMLIDFEGTVVFSSFTTDLKDDPKTRDWGLFINILSSIREADLIFEKYRFYIRKSEAGYLIVMLGKSVPMAILRLNCDILLPSLKSSKAGLGFKRFFRK